MIPQYIFIVNSYVSGPKTSKPLILIARLTVPMPKIYTERSRFASSLAFRYVFPISLCKSNCAPTPPLRRLFLSLSLKKTTSTMVFLPTIAYNRG